MEAIEILMNEHRLIERVCDALDAFADGAARRSADGKDELAKFVAFIAEFADAHHHGKEEDILFAELVNAGFSREYGPVAVMLAEHARGRACVAELRRLAHQPESWSDDDRHALLDAAHGYSALLHQHIHKEDAILYPMAEQRLPPESLQRVEADCAAFEARRSGTEHDRLHALGEELVERYAPGAPAPRAVGCCG